MDTFVISIPRLKHKVTDPTRFKKHFYPIDPYDPEQCRNFIQEHGGYRKFIQNPLASYREQGIIYPNLTIDERLRYGNIRVI